MNIIVSLQVSVFLMFLVHVLLMLGDEQQEVVSMGEGNIASASQGSPRDSPRDSPYCYPLATY